MAENRSGGRGTGRRWRQWKESEARSALAEWKESGLGADAFARSKGVSAQRLRYWSGRLAAVEPVRFVAVRPATRSEGRIEIEHGGIVVRIREDIDAGRLAQIVAALASAEASC